MSTIPEAVFSCRDVRITIADKQVVKGVSLTVRP